LTEDAALTFVVNVLLTVVFWILVEAAFLGFKT